MTPETTQLGLLKTLAAQDEEIKTLRAQVAQYKEDAEKSLATIAACKDRFQRILDEPNNTMSDRKAMREVMRQANLGLSACAAIDKARKS